jgi:SAM-dependent methyltransferase
MYPQMRGGRIALLIAFVAGNMLQTETIHIPQACHWAIKDLFSLQRVDPRRGTDSQSVTKAIWSIFEESLLGLLPPTSDAPNIVDIGPGLAMYHIYISRFYNNSSRHFLVDKSKNECGLAAPGSRKYHRFCAGYRSNASNFKFYTSLTCAQSILMANGLKSESIQFVNPTGLSVRKLGCSTVDVVISLASMGFHYSVEEYIEAIVYILKPGGALILTITRENMAGGMDQIRILSKYGFRCTANARRQGKYHQLLNCTSAPSSAAVHFGTQKTCM